MREAEELYSLFRRCFPFAVRAEDTARRVLADPKNLTLTRQDGAGRLIAASVAHGDCVYMLAVDAAHRRQGLGSALLAETEDRLRAAGHAAIRVGAGEDYLLPGVPLRTPPHDEGLDLSRLDPRLDDEAAGFFLRRGYRHSWGEANCFDMAMDLKDLPSLPVEIGGRLEGIEYRWALPADREAVCRCTDDAWDEFTRYYRDLPLYGDGPQRTLIALDGEAVCGALIVSREAEAPGLGSVGCTAVAHGWRGRRVAARLVLLGSGSLRDAGLRRGFLGYTYSGLDKLYGLAGYRVTALYFMAEKSL